NLLPPSRQPEQNPLLRGRHATASSEASTGVPLSRSEAPNQRQRQGIADTAADRPFAGLPRLTGAGNARGQPPGPSPDTAPGGSLDVAVARVGRGTAKSGRAGSHSPGGREAAASSGP